LLYGLEPVFEPAIVEGANEASGGTQLQRMECPYCGESYQTLVDLSGGSATYVEDCQVCCQPIELAVDVDLTGAFARLVARRGD
jgi:Cysteine-rich CPXCG